MYIEIGGHVLEVALCQNAAVDALRALLEKGAITLCMKDFAHMEKFASLGTTLPSSDEYITTQAGDVILSDGHLLVLYYASNTWQFTRLGKVQNRTDVELKKILGSGNLQARVSLEIE